MDSLVTLGGLSFLLALLLTPAFRSLFYSYDLVGHPDRDRIVALSLPILDTCLAVTRQFRRRALLADASREHPAGDSLR